MTDKVLVTGGCGFIGSHLQDRLISDGYKVVVLDDLSTGARSNLASDSEFVQGSVADRPLLESLFASHDFVSVFHMAAVINTSIEEEDINRDVATSVNGTINLFEIGASANVRSFFYASSVAIYGSPNPEDLPVSETCMPAPIFSYGIAKLCAEQYAMYLSNRHGIPCCVARYGNIFGPRQPRIGEVGVISIFSERYLENALFKVFGDGNHVRDYLYVGDAIDATMALHSLGQSGVYNVASGAATTVNELVNLFSEIRGQPVPVQHAPERTNELGQFVADISKISNMTNWRPGTDLMTGIRATIAGG